ncbi:MAG: orotidine-5'-phosphate decarboxylase [Deltaproteobacteria bacterium]|nr:orotidine-5'-phosphate decarboxylase [Deltaproteobacteria bacterium]
MNTMTTLMNPESAPRPQDRIILALDVDTLNSALEWVERTRGLVGAYKVGLQLFSRVGPRAVAEIRMKGVEVMLDLKLHDIPNTVAQAVRAVSVLGPKFLTVHAAGGGEMIRAALREAGEMRVVAVTVLTSLNATEADVLVFARVAYESGVRAFVASAWEAGPLRRTFPGSIIITPGVRPAGALAHDQARVASPRDAIAAGADYVVVGRPVIESENPVETLQTIATQIAAPN